jgi:hypothetical protein
MLVKISDVSQILGLSWILPLTRDRELESVDAELRSTDFIVSASEANGEVSS